MNIDNSSLNRFKVLLKLLIGAMGALLSTGIELGDLKGLGRIVLYPIIARFTTDS
jgi:hypothetical protein